MTSENNKQNIFKLKENEKRNNHVRDLIFESTKVLEREEAWERIIKKSKSVWAFFRATNVVFWNDLADNALIKEYGNPKISNIWICGDAHFQNIGAQKSKKEITYTFNDFDDAVVADYQYDLIRLVIAVYLQTEHLREQLTEIFIHSYINYIKEFYNPEKETENTLRTGVMTSWLHFLKKKKKKKWLKKLVKKDRFIIKFKLHKKLQPIAGKNHEMIKNAMSETIIVSKRQQDLSLDKTLSVNKRIEGLGSFLRDRYYVLTHNKKREGRIRYKNLNILDVKYQSEPSAFVNSKKIQDETMYYVKNHGERVVVAQKAMSTVSESVLGYLKMNENHFSVREVLPLDEKFPVNFNDSETISEVVAEWGRLFASAHMKSATYLSKPFPEFINKTFTNETVINQYITKIKSLAEIYTDQIKFDFKQWSTISTELQKSIDEYYTSPQKN